MTKRKRPQRRRVEGEPWSNLPSPSGLEDFDAVIERTAERLAFVAETGAIMREDGSIILVPTPLQNEILRILSGRLLTKEQMADAICGGHGNLFYRKKDLPELVRLGLVAKRRGGGFYRPDAPPPDTLFSNR